MRVSAFISSLVLLIAASVASASSVTYSFLETAGNKTATGTITTDGATGALSNSDITSFTLTVSNGTSTSTVTNATGYFNTVGGNLSASSTSLLFNFGGPSGSAFAIYDKAFNLLCISVANACSQNYGDNILIGLNASFSEVNTTATTQVVASVIPASTPEPSSFVLLGTGLFGVAGVTRKCSLR